MKSLKNLDNMRKSIPEKYFPVFVRVQIQAPHVFAQKLIPQEFPVLPFLVFLEFLVFSPCEIFLVVLTVFHFFSRDFRGSVGIKKSLFFLVVFPAFFQKKQGKEGQGSFLHVLVLCRGVI